MRSKPTPALLPLLCFVLVAGFAPAQCDLEWAPGDGLPGTNGTVYATTSWDPDGAGPADPLVVVGGHFDRVGPLATPSIAAWDPATGTWSAFGSGILGSVAALAVMPNGDLVAGGYWITPGGTVIDRMMRWDGTGWVPFGFGTVGSVMSLLVTSSGDLLVGGDFDLAGGVPSSGIAKWDGSSWSQFGVAPGITTSTGTRLVNALIELPTGDIVVAGRFTHAGGAVVNSLTRWDGTTWQTFGPGLPPGGLDQIRVLHRLPNGDLIAGGLFFSIGGVIVNHIARWDGATWHPLGSGVSWAMNGSGVYSVSARPNGDLAVGGYFTQASGQSANGIAQWNGSNWAPMAGGGSTNTQLVLPNGDLIAGGAFKGTGEGVSRWDGTAWNALATGFNDRITSLAVLPNGNVVAGGYFTYAGSGPVGRIAVTDGTSWSSLGSGMTSTTLSSPYVRLLAVAPNGDLFAAGYFTHAGGVAAAGIARWDGTAWWPLGAFNNSSLNAMLVTSNGDLVVAGNFSTIGGVTAKGVARWDGVAWHAMGAGMTSTVRALAVLPNGDPVAAGDFLMADGVVANRVASWDGTTWAPLGAGLPGNASSLVVMANGDLVATGTFGMNQRWNGSSWSSLGSGLAGAPNALLSLPNGDLLAGGLSSLVTVSGLVTMARWSAGSWTPLPTWPAGSVLAMVRQVDGSIAVGGTFAAVGSQTSAYLARLTTPCPGTVTGFAAGCPSSGGSNTLTAVTLPWVDSTFRATGTGLPTSAIVLALTSVNAVAPPLALSSVFAEAPVGCDLHVAPDIVETLFTANGTATSQLFLPNTPPLVGVTFFHQMVPIEVDPLLNFVQITATNVLQLTAGQF